MTKPSSTGTFGKLSIYPGRSISEDESGVQPTTDGETGPNHNYQQQGNSGFSSTISRSNRSSENADTNSYSEVRRKFCSKLDVRYIIIADFDDEMMQDALAIVQFPRIGFSGLEDMEQWKSEVPILMHNWARQTIHDPILKAEQDSQYLIYSIHKLHQRMLMYVQDYINKATSRSVLRAYSRLPSLAPGENSTNGQGLQRDFNLGKLGKSGRRRLFWAFLRYELMSKIRLYKSVVDRFYIPPLELERRRGKLLRTWETEALFCVRAYSSSLYRAFFVQWPEDELPDTVLPHDPLSTSSEVPSQMVHLARAWTNEDDRQMEDWLCIMTRFPNFGFDLITVLIIATDALPDYLGLSERIKAFASNIARPGCCDEVHKGLSRNFPIRRIGDEDTPGLFREIISYHGSYYTIPMRNAEMYRYRAWPFFNHVRGHPQYSAFVPRSIANADASQTQLNGEHQHLDQNRRLYVSSAAVRLPPAVATTASAVPTTTAAAAAAPRPAHPQIDTPPPVRPGRAIAEFLKSRAEARENRR